MIVVEGGHACRTCNTASRFYYHILARSFWSIQSLVDDLHEFREVKAKLLISTIMNTWVDLNGHLFERLLSPGNSVAIGV